MADLRKEYWYSLRCDSDSRNYWINNSNVDSVFLSGYEVDLLLQSTVEQFVTICSSYFV